MRCGDGNTVTLLDDIRYRPSVGTPSGVNRWLPMRDYSEHFDKTEIQQRITKLEQEAQLLPPGRVLEAALREIRQLRSLAVAKRWADVPERINDVAARLESCSSTRKI